MPKKLFQAVAIGVFGLTACNSMNMPIKAPTPTAAITFAPTVAPAATQPRLPNTATPVEALLPRIQLELVRTYEFGSDAFAWSPDGKSIAFGAGAVVELRNAASGALETELAIPPAGLMGGGQVIFSPDGEWLAQAGLEEHIVIWHYATGELVHVIDNAGIRSRIGAIAFSPDARTLAVSFQGETGSAIHLWDTKTWKEINQIDLQATAIAFSGSGRLLAAGRGLGSGITGPIVQLWETEPLQLVGELRLVDGKTPMLFPEVLGLAFASDDKKVCAIVSGQLHVWDVTTGADTASRLLEEGGELLAMAISSRGLLALIDREGFITLIDSNTWAAVGEAQYVIGEPRSFYPSLQFRSDGAQLLAGSLGSKLQLWEVP